MRQERSGIVALDIGSAPGGWTQCLSSWSLHSGWPLAEVVAVDPAEMVPGLVGGGGGGGDMAAAAAGGGGGEAGAAAAATATAAATAATAAAATAAAAAATAAATTAAATTTTTTATTAAAAAAAVKITHVKSKIEQAIPRIKTLLGSKRGVDLVVCDMNCAPLPLLEAAVLAPLRAGILSRGACLCITLKVRDRTLPLCIIPVQTQPYPHPPPTPLLPSPPLPRPFAGGAERPQTSEWSCARGSCVRPTWRGSRSSRRWPTVRRRRRWFVR